MLSHLAMFTARTTARTPLVARHHRAGLPRAFDAPRPVALASWRMGGGGAPADANDAPPPRRARRRDDDDDYDDYDDYDDDSAFSRAPQRRAPRDRAPRGRDRAGPDRRPQPRGRRGGRGGGAPRHLSDDDHATAPSRTIWQERHDEKKRNRVEPTLAESLVGEALYGLNPARAALAARRRDVHRAWVQDGSDAASDPVLRAAAANLGLELEPVSKHDLNMLVGGGATGIRPHNGVVLDASPLTPTPADSLPGWDGVGAPPLWLALDEVVDPQNFGAVLRSAHFLGIAGVVVCAKNSAPLSPAVSKASSGAMETETVYSAGAMHRFLARCAEEGWDVLGAAAESDAVDVTEVAVERPTVLVMGNEGRGLRTNVRRACSKMVKVEGAPGGSQGGVDSLNVSVATGIMLHTLLTAAKRRI